MKLDIYIYTGVSELLEPFRKHLCRFKYVKVVRVSVGREQWEITTQLLDVNKNPIIIVDTDIIKNIVSLWGEKCFADWLNNICGNIIFHNMRTDEHIEMV